MKADTGPEATRNYSLAVRWVAATAIVFAVGLGGFVLRGDGSQRREPLPPPRTKTTAAEGGTLFPEVPHDPAVGIGAEPQANGNLNEPTLTDFAGCDHPPQPLTSNPPRGWTRHVASPSRSYPVEFDHPGDWDVVEEGEQLAAVSPDGERAFVVELVPFADTTVPMRDVFSAMQNMDPVRRYSAARSVVVNGKQGCAATASGDGHSGLLVLLRGDGVIAVLTAGHDLEPDPATLAEAWTLISSVRIGG